MDEKRIDDQIPEEAAPKTRDASFVKKAGKRVWEAIRSLPGEFLNFWRSYPPKARKIAVILAAVVLVAGVVGTLMFPDYTDCAFYLKDGELYLATADGHTRRITEKLIEAGAVDGFKSSKLSDALKDYIQLSKDGRSLFYPDHASVRNGTGGTAYLGTYDLYWTDLTNPWQEPVKIASQVKHNVAYKKQYIVSHKAHWAIYESDKTLYQYDRSGTSVVATDLRTLKFSDDGRAVAYFIVGTQRKTGTIYVKRGSSSPEIIAEDVLWGGVAFNEDMSAVAGKKEDGIFFYHDNKLAFTLDSDSAVIGAVTGKNTMYYFTRNNQEYKQSQLVVDDWKGEAYEGYSHDEIMEMLENATVYQEMYTLWYYNGVTSVKITDTAVQDQLEYQKNAMNAYLFTDYRSSETPKFKLSDLIAYCEREKIKNVTYGARQLANNYWSRKSKYYYVCFGASKTLIDLDSVWEMWMREDGKVIYARTWSYSDSKQSFEHKLYRIDLLGTFATSPKLENGYNWGVFAGKTFMGRDFSGSGGAADYTQTIFLNGKEVVSDVSGYASLPYYCEKTETMEGVPVFRWTLTNLTPWKTLIAN